MPNQYYRLRVRPAIDNNPADPDTILVTSLRGGESPYIAEPPSGDGQEVDLLTGAVRIGAYRVRVVDAKISTNATGVVRSITHYLYQSYSDPRPALLSRRAYIEMSTDGTTWSTWQAGYVTDITQDDAITYTFTISDTRRVETSQQIFTWSTTAEQTAFPKRGCLWGGPVIGGFGATSGGAVSAIDSGGWEFKYKAMQQGVAAFTPAAYYLPPKFQKQTSLNKDFVSVVMSIMQGFLEYAPPDTSFTTDTFIGLHTPPSVFSFPNVQCIIEEPGTANVWRGSIRGFLSPLTNDVGWSNLGVTSGTLVPQTAYFLYVTFDSANVSGGSPTPAMTVDKVYRVRAISREVTESSPLYFDLHPVDIVTKLYDLVNIPYKSGASTTANTWQWAKQELGADLRLAARITSASTLSEFLDRSIFGPFGFSTRTNASGQKEFFLTRKLGYALPSVTISNVDVRGDDLPPIYALGESTALTGFEVTQQQLVPWVQVQGSTELPPPDNIVAQSIKRVFPFADTTTYSTRIISYDIPGMVHDANTFTADPVRFGAYIGNELAVRFARGAPISELPVLRTSAAANLQIGDEVQVNVSSFPNRNYRIGEAASVGPRCMQVVRRQETPEGPTYKLVDSGALSQSSIAPTFTLSASSGDPYRVAQFTIDNAATLNGLSGAKVFVEYTISDTTPLRGGTSFVTYTAPDIPTTAIQLPPVASGSRVWIRGQTIETGSRPSLYSNWGATGANVLLTTMPTPSGMATSNKSKTFTNLTWSLGSPAVTRFPVELYLYQGASAPADWTPYRINTLASGSTQTSLYNLTGNTTYVAGICFRDSVNNLRGPMHTLTFTTLSAAFYPTTYEALPFAKFLTSTGGDATAAIGVAVAYYPVDGYFYELQRAPDVSGSAGTYATLIVLDDSRNVYVDALPDNGTLYWYRIRTLGQLAEDSSWFVIGSTSATKVPLNVTAPQQIAPTITYDIRYTATDGIVTFAINGASGGVNNSVSGGGVWDGDLSASVLTFPPDYTASPLTIARLTGTDQLFTIGARNDGLETRSYFTIVGI
jgi:hypothetical protein